MLVVLRSHNFVSAEQAAAFLGVVPIEKRSGTSVRRRPRMSKIGPPQLRAKLYMSALCGKIYNKRMRNIWSVRLSGSMGLMTPSTETGITLSP